MKPTAIYFNNAAITSQKYKTAYKNVLYNVINSGIFFYGEQTKLLEKTLRNFFNNQYITTVASGHDALFIALSSLNLTKNDEVIFPANAYPTSFPIALSGAKPVPVDVDSNGQIDPNSLINKISSKTKAIVIVHMYGLVGKLDEVNEIANKKRITLIEDCAQAFGSTFKKKLVGTFGDIACFSFYPTKNIGTLGNGGALLTKKKRLFNYFLKAKQYGEYQRYKSKFISHHSRIPEIQAGFLNILLSNFQKEVIKRKKIHSFYFKCLNNHPIISPLLSHPNSNPIPHLFVVSCKKRDALKEHLSLSKIESHIHYPTPIHLLPAFSHLGYKKGDFPTAEYLSKTIISLPFHSYLKLEQIKYICNQLRSFYENS